MGSRFFDDDEYRRRLVALRSRLRDADLDALLVTGPENICYLTGYTTPGYHIFQCLIVPQEEKNLTFVVRNIEAVNVPDLPWIGETYPIPVHQLKDPVGVVLNAFNDLGLAAAKIGYDDASQFFPPRVLDQLRQRLAKATLRPAGGLVEQQRAIKSPAEIELIRKAVAIAEEAIRAGADAIRHARTDSDVAAAVHARLAELGSEYTGSPPYIVAGLDSLITHTTHARRPLTPGCNVRMEVCASVGRYHGVATRIGVKGEPSATTRRIFDLSKRALEGMIAAARPGLPIGEMDRAGRSIVEAEVPPSYWPNRGGYSMGISYPPGLGEGDVLDIKPGDTRLLEEGMVFHLLPTMRSPEAGAIGCTETVVITADGCETLSTLPRELLVR